MIESKHADCSPWDHGECQAGEPETCEKVAIYRKRQDEIETGAWRRLIPKREPGGWRHYLEGKPIHCGELIELQGFEWRSDDYGDYRIPKQAGFIVRYETAWRGLQADEPKVILYGYIGGHEFTAPLGDSMRFRWPERKR